MGIKELWPLLTPYCERKPINILRGKVIAIDLAGWVCESLNVVDYFIHPRQYMKNLFFRTCYMLLEGIIPVFILEGKAPELKSKIIQQRNEIQFRGVKPRQNNENSEKDQQVPSNNKQFKGRTRFNYVLKNCEELLNCLGVTCIQAPGEAEAYCAFLNKNGLVDGIISQDSDCFAYGAITVYRNFAVSTQGTNSAQGGSVDIYDMRKICKEMDFGQDKIIVLALFCGCDYNDGICGIGKDTVLKLFKKYKNSEILERIKSWRLNDTKYSELEMKVNDKNICSNCGHLGKTLSHTKSGCSVCRLSKGCLETFWREEKQIIKAELILRQKSLQDLHFPSQDIINEFLTQYNIPLSLRITWEKPNIVKFIKNIGKLLQWTEIYCFQKFLPILTRWQLQSFVSNNKLIEIITPDLIVKKRVTRGIPSFEIIWKDENNLLEGLIPDDQVQSYSLENCKGIQGLWSTIEPVDLFEKTYKEIVESFLKSKEKPKKAKVTNKNKKKERDIKNTLDMSSLIESTDEISHKIKKTKKTRKGLQLIDKFFYKSTPKKYNKKNMESIQSSTPKQKLTLLDLDNDECSHEKNNLSEIINDIVSNPCDKNPNALLNISKKMLIYETIDYQKLLEYSKDELDLLPSKRTKLNDSLLHFNSAGIVEKFHKTYSFDDISILELENETNKGVSYFFEKLDDICSDEFEKSVVVNLSDFD